MRLEENEAPNSLLALSDPFFGTNDPVQLNSEPEPAAPFPAVENSSTQSIPLPTLIEPPSEETPVAAVLPSNSPLVYEVTHTIDFD